MSHGATAASRRHYGDHGLDTVCPGTGRCITVHHGEGIQQVEFSLLIHSCNRYRHVNMGNSNISSGERLRLMGLQLLMTEQMNQNALLMAKFKLNREKRQREVGEDAEEKTQKKRAKKRSLWVRQWLQRRPQLGQYRKLLAELKKEDTKGFKNFLRMDYPTFREILDRIEPRIKKQGCNFRKPLSPGIKLAITLYGTWLRATATTH